MAGHPEKKIKKSYHEQTWREAVIETAVYIRSQAVPIMIVAVLVPLVMKGSELLVYYYYN